MEIKTHTAPTKAQLAKAKRFWNSVAKQLKAVIDKGETPHEISLSQVEHDLLWMHNDHLHREGDTGITPQDFFGVAFKVNPIHQLVKKGK